MNPDKRDDGVMLTIFRVKPGASVSNANGSIRAATWADVEDRVGQYVREYRDLYPIGTELLVFASGRLTDRMYRFTVATPEIPPPVVQRRSF